MELGKRMKTLREMLGISQQAIADQLGSTQSSINRYENDQTLPPVDDSRWHPCHCASGIV